MGKKFPNRKVPARPGSLPDYLHTKYLPLIIFLGVLVEERVSFLNNKFNLL